VIHLSKQHPLHILTVSARVALCLAGLVVALRASVVVPYAPQMAQTARTVADAHCLAEGHLTCILALVIHRHCPLTFEIGPGCLCVSVVGCLSQRFFCVCLLVVEVVVKVVCHSVPFCLFLPDPSIPFCVFHFGLAMPVRLELVFLALLPVSSNSLQQLQLFCRATPVRLLLVFLTLQPVSPNSLQQLLLVCRTRLRFRQLRCLRC